MRLSSPSSRPATSRWPSRARAPRPRRSTKTAPQKTPRRPSRANTPTTTLARASPLRALPRRSRGLTSARRRPPEEPNRPYDSAAAARPREALQDPRRRRAAQCPRGDRAPTRAVWQPPFGSSRKRAALSGERDRRVPRAERRRHREAGQRPATPAENHYTTNRQSRTVSIRKNKNAYQVRVYGFRSVTVPTRKAAEKVELDLKLRRSLGELYDEAETTLGEEIDGFCVEARGRRVERRGLPAPRVVGEIWAPFHDTPVSRCDVSKSRITSLYARR